MGSTVILMIDYMFYRSLSKNILKNVLSYLHVDGGANLVCKYWNLVIKEVKMSPETDETQTKIRYSRSDIKSMLYDIKSKASQTKDQSEPTVQRTERASISPIKTSAVLETKSDSDSEEDPTDVRTIIEQKEEQKSHSNQLITHKASKNGNGKESEGYVRVPSRKSSGIQVSYDNILNQSAQHHQPLFMLANTSINGILSPLKPEIIEAPIKNVEIPLIPPPEKIEIAPVTTTVASKLSRSTSALVEKRETDKSPKQSVEPPLPYLSKKKTITKAIDLPLPTLAEPKRKSSSTAKATATSATTTHKKSHEDKFKNKSKHQTALDFDADKNLLLHVQKIRSEQQLDALIEYIQAGYIKIDSLVVEKRRLKKLIKAWNATYEKNLGRPPNASERKGHYRELFEEYQQVRIS